MAKDIPFVLVTLRASVEQCAAGAKFGICKGIEYSGLFFLVAVSLISVADIYGGRVWSHGVMMFEAVLVMLVLFYVGKKKNYPHSPSIRFEELDEFREFGVPHPHIVKTIENVIIGTPEDRAAEAKTKELLASLMKR